VARSDVLYGSNLISFSSPKHGENFAAINILIDVCQFLIGVLNRFSLQNVKFLILLSFTQKHRKYSAWGLCR